MAAILNGFLPVRRKDAYAQERILNTRWGDASISAPIHGGWNTNPAVAATQESPDLDRDLPPTPPQGHEEQDGVYIVRDEGVGHDESEDDNSRKQRDNFTITIPLPWKKKSKTNARQPSSSNILNSRFTQPRRIDALSPPPLATAEAAAIPLPESRVTSPVGRTTTTSPVLSFRSRLASPNLGDMLSPVAEGFAKTGPATRPTPVLSPLQYVQSPPLDRPPTAGSMRSRRPSVDKFGSEGLGAGTMSSQATLDEQAPEMQRPHSRGIGATAHMRASSRGPRAGSRGPRAPSVEPFPQAAASIEPVSRVVESTIIEPTPVFGPVLDLEPVRRRAPSVGPAARRPPSIGPISNRRALSREPRGRRGESVEPRPRVRFMSEAPPGTRFERTSYSSNDGSIDSDSDNHISTYRTDGIATNATRFEQEYKPTRMPQRRRSIASPISSPTTAAFGITEIIAPPVVTANVDLISTQADRIEPAIARVPAQRSAPRNRSKSRTRGLYGDMQDDFRLLARDVHNGNTPSTAAAVTPTVPTSTTSQTLPTHLTSPQQRAVSPALSSNPPGSFATGLATAAALRVEPERTGYSSDSSIVANLERQAEQDGGKALLAALARERKDQLRREERERAREKVTRKLERERERIMAMNALSDCESTASGHMSGSEKTRRVYGGSVGSENEFYTRKSKTLVPNAEEIWG